jgi:SAM-dependent methyltransferase
VSDTPSASISYDPAFYDPIGAAEDTHFWYQARNEVIGALVEECVAPLPDGHRVLEVGCGGGTVLRMLEARCSRGTVVGLDFFAEGLRRARRRTRCAMVQADLHWPPFRERFDLIGLFDVLEHLEDDEAVLHRLHEMTVPGGALLLTVPSRPGLWSYFDEAARHHRRYELEALVSVVTRAGYDVSYASEYMAPLLPMAWLQRRVLARLRRGAGPTAAPEELAASDLEPVSPLVNRVLRSVLGLESRAVARHRRLPFGTSIVLLARCC